MSMSAKNHAADRRAYQAYAAAKDPNATPSRTHVNSAITERLTVSTAQLARPEGNDAANIQSRGV
jgi:hypothetical protein